jgi:tRNA(adenine34) deaminase
MESKLGPQDTAAFQEAIRLAVEAEHRGNLPIGGVIALDGEIIASGSNAIWQPSQELTRHAEMEALRAVPGHLWRRSREMTLYTTLEPCLMCAGAILLHRLGRLVFGSRDPWGGVSACLGSLPSFFKDEFSLIQWAGPAFPSECDPLYARVLEYERSHGRPAAVS